MNEAVLEVDECAVEKKLRRELLHSLYEYGAAEERDEEMEVVDSDAVHGQGTVVVVANAAPIAHAAVVHPRKLERLTLFAVAPAIVAALERKPGVTVDCFLVRG